MDYHSDTVTEAMIEKMEKELDIDYNRGEVLEVFTINKANDEVLMKVGTPGAILDLHFAARIKNFFNKNNIPYRSDDRDVIVSTESFVKLFG